MLMTSALGVSFLTFLVVAALTPVLIWALRTFKLVQPIRAEMPAGIQAKKGTPLMAGLILLIGSAVSYYAIPNPLTAFLSATFLLFSVVGFLDDFKKAVYQDPGGISGRAKLIMQFVFTGVLLYYLFVHFDLSPQISLFGSYKLDLPMLVYVCVMMLFVVGSANAINFTDGLDGLLIVVAIPTYLFFFAISERPEVEVFSLVMIACLLGLFIYNVFPAKAFMGDTGSLAIGGSLSFLAILEKVELLIPLLFFVYFAEQLSVILQVWYYKRTKLRIFRMAPIHYHYSLKYGWSENRIVLVFGTVSSACALLSWVIWKLWM